MRIPRCVWRLAGVVVIAAGCGEISNEVPISGTVTLNGTPLANAELIFRPINDTPGVGGSARTGADGAYKVTGGRGEKGLVPGEYAVAVSRRLRPDGSPADPNVPPIESDARETLPPTYSDLDKSKLRATVSVGSAVQDFALQVKK